MSDASLEVAEVTELGGLQPLVRQLVMAAFRERLGEVDVSCEFHRGWNGGWRCRATITTPRDVDGDRPSARRRLEFVILRTRADELIALPVPMPVGWTGRGVAGSRGGRFVSDAAGNVRQLSASDG